MGRRRVAILGSTGSIGTQALDVVARHPDLFEIVGLAAGRNTGLLREQARRFGPKITTTAEDGQAGLRRVAVESDAEIVVAAGELLVQTARASGARLLPVDSEHSAIFQCLIGEERASVAAILLTASGGPFWRTPREAMENADLAAALAHPTWRMGTKNTIDSATMMNKGLEVIEASRLFEIEGERIRIVVHPQSIAHGFVIFRDGSVKSQLAAPDMRVPIGYALAYPKRLRTVGAPQPADPGVLQALGAKDGERALR